MMRLPTAPARVFLLLLSAFAATECDAWVGPSSDAAAPLGARGAARLSLLPSRAATSLCIGTPRYFGGWMRSKNTASSPTALSVSDRSSISESDQTLLGASGTLAALLVLYSEFTLKTTGCGLPAGPFGLLGAAEGIGYLAVVGLVGYSLFTKFQTGSGLPAGPNGILGAAEGLSFVAVAAGLVVLGFQIADYGYIPNAVPMEGGMCS